MGDIALIWSEENLGDIATVGADLQNDEGLQTAVLISLFTDRRASTNEELPAGETNRRGWWGDVEPPASGDEIGSRLWLLYREKQLQSVVARAEEYAREALQWLIDDKVAQRVEVIVEGEKYQELDIQVSIYRPSGDAVQFRYNYAWQSQAAKIVQ
ncbi:MAG: phage GP46 family protein [Novosphingobium sp.]